MKQGRKSKTMLAIGCTLAMLVAAMAIAPAAALADDSAANEEYNLGPISNTGNGGPGAQPGDSQVTGSSNGGGAPILLIALAVIAAGCTGLAIWRLRRHGHPTDPGEGEGSTGVTGESPPL